MESALLVLRFAAFFQILFLVFVAWQQGKGIPSTRWIALFALSIGCYLMCPVVFELRFKGYFWLVLPVFAGCFGVSFFFWAMTGSLFDDSFRVSRLHWLAFFALEAVSFFLFSLKLSGELDAIVAGEYGRLAAVFPRLFPQIISLTFIIMALVKAHAGRDDDLLEGRRRFRSVFVLGIGAYAVVVIAVELTMADDDVPLLELVNNVLILAMIYVFSAILLRLRGELLPDYAPPAKTPAAAVPPVDAELVGRLRALMEEEKLYREEGLSLRDLAARLNKPEYKLRPLINRGLGYKNYNDFLNHYRIEEARGILADPEQRELPIIRIAMDLGFGSLAPFNRAFRRKTDTTPSEYRRRMIGP